MWDDKLIIPLPTQRRFATLDVPRDQYLGAVAKTPITVLISPQGEGKTVGAIGTMLYHADFFYPKLVRGAIIRDRHTNLQRHTIPSIRRVLETTVTFHRDDRLMRCQNLECDLFGIDDPASLTALQGGEYDLYWLEEPAPIYETGNAGLSEDVFDIASSRGPREEGRRLRVIVSMNPASEDHWTHLRFIDNPDPRLFLLQIPYGENIHLPPNERANTMAAFKHRPELYARYVEGKFSFVPLGEAVMPEYNERIHRSQEILNPIPNVMGYRFWDGGLYPSCVIAQITPKGRFMGLDTLRGENMGMKQFLQSQVKPLLGRRYDKINAWKDLGDPSLNEREQSDSSQTAAQIINGELGTVFEGGISGWEARRESFKELLTRLVDGEPMFCLSKHEGILHRGLKGGWHYHKDNSGNVIRDIPVKDIHSHPCDAVSHGIAKIFQYKTERQYKSIDRDRRKFANSYGMKKKAA